MDEPVTKQDLRDAVAALRAYADKRCELVETRLLTAFQGWASPNEARQRTHAAGLRALELEMEAMDNRVKKLEGGTAQ